MAANDIAIRWSTLTDFATITNLNSLADGSIWQSGAIDTAASPTELYLRIWYELVFNATPVAGDSLRFYVAGGDEDATSEIWDGGIGTSEAELTVASNAADIAAVKAALSPSHVHAWQTNHGTTFAGRFTVENFPESWQLLIEADGEALAASGHRVAYEYGVPQVQ